MMSIDRINNLTQPYSDNTLYKTPVKRTPMNYTRNNLSAATTPIMPQNHDLENVYDDLLRLPKMPKSPSEMEPIPVKWNQSLHLKMSCQDTMKGEGKIFLH